MQKGRRDLPKTLNQRSARRLLESDGWTMTVGGKHQVKMEKAGQRPITLPQNKGRDYPKGLRDAILRQAGLKNVADSAETEAATETEGD